MYKERKETTYVELGEEDIHHHHIYIKDKHNVCKKMVTRSVYKRLKEAPKTTRR